MKNTAPMAPLRLLSQKAPGAFASAPRSRDWMRFHRRLAEALGSP
jgi:hypothetical protein